MSRNDKIEVIIAPFSFFSEIHPPPLCTVRAFNAIVSRHAFRTRKKVNLKMVKDRQVDPPVMVGQMSWAKCKKTVVRGQALLFFFVFPVVLDWRLACFRCLGKTGQNNTCSGGGGDTVGILGWGCAAGTLEP